MELDEFVKKTILSIVKGVGEASQKIDESFPEKEVVVNSQNKDSWGDYNTQLVDFDIAITASDKLEGSGQAGIKVIGIQGKQSFENSEATRIKFSIPVGFKHYSKPFNYTQFYD